MLKNEYYFPYLHLHCFLHCQRYLSKRFFFEAILVTNTKLVSIRPHCAEILCIVEIRLSTGQKFSWPKMNSRMKMFLVISKESRFMVLTILGVFNIKECFSYCSYIMSSLKEGGGLKSLPKIMTWYMNIILFLHVTNTHIQTTIDTQHSYIIVLYMSHIYHMMIYIIQSISQFTTMNTFTAILFTTLVASSVSHKVEMVKTK